MNKTRGVLKIAALAAAAVITAGVPLSMQRGTASAGWVALYTENDSNYTMNTSGDLTYAKFTDHIEVYNCAKGVTSVEIPETIDGLPVTAVMRYGFQGCSLKSITIPESVTTIGYYAFAMCSDLTTVKLPDSLQVMEMHAFELCHKLETVEFPDHIFEMHSKVFDETAWLDAQRKKDPLVIVNGALIDARTAEGDVEIPSSVEYVSPSAFSWNTKVTSVVVPSTVKTLCDNTFFHSESLTSVELKGVEEIESMAFCGCPKLNDLKISGKLKKMADDTFVDTTASATITFYGSKDTWEKVGKPTDSEFLKKANMVFDESHSEPEEIKGDVNMDGVFNLSDVILLQKWLLAVPNTELKNWKAADLCADNVLDVFDLCLMRRELLKKI